MPDRNDFRPGWHRYTPRYPRQMGFRGKVLILCGVVWIMLGFGVLDAPRVGVPHEAIPAPMQAGLWVATGAIAIASGWRPPGYQDALGWLALYLMPALRTVSYTIGWIDSLTPYGGPGYARGWVNALTYGVMVVFIYLCASWPDPPVIPESKEQ